MLHRFYQPSLLPDQDELQLNDPTLVKQLTTVLRLAPGDRFVLFTPHTEYTVAFQSAEPNAVRARIIRTTTPDRSPARHLILYQALLKKDNFELILQKGTELGIREFVPLVTQRTIVREISPHKQSRYRKIVTEATEQCGGADAPTIQETLTIDALCQRISQESGAWLTAYEADTTTLLADILATVTEPIRLIIGPEGGFTPGEIERLSAAGAHIVSLGSRILRAETAAIAAASLILLS